MNILRAAAYWECTRFWAQPMQHIPFPVKCVCREGVKLSSRLLWCSFLVKVFLHWEQTLCNGCLRNITKQKQLCNTNCAQERVSCKCCGVEYLFPCEYYDRYQRTQPDLELFFMDHVCNMGRAERIKCGNHKCFSNRVMLFYNTKCLSL